MYNRISEKKEVKIKGKCKKKKNYKNRKILLKIKTFDVCKQFSHCVMPSRLRGIDFQFQHLVKNIKKKLTQKQKGLES